VQIKLALPKGQLQDSTAYLLKEVGLNISGYSEGSRSYRPQCSGAFGLFLKVFHEKDIAIQVAIGNYDLGICRLDWVEELLTKYYSEGVVKVRDLGYGRRNLYAVAAQSSGNSSLETLKDHDDSLRIASEYPNLAETFALKQRLRRFQIFPVWGSAGVYPPENAELAIITEFSSKKLKGQGLVPVATLLESSAYLIANRDSLKRKNLSRLLASLSTGEVNYSHAKEPPAVDASLEARYSTRGKPLVSLALPDGHQQRHVVAFLNRAGLKIEGYNVGKASTRPRIDIDGVAVKVIRPQDMPLQVANGNFDLAITGRDWLRDHLYRFPSSPVDEVLDLGFGKVRIVAVVSEDLHVSSASDLRKMRKDSALRVASEYVNIADKYAHDNHLVPYKLIPTWGASEAFLPEDADVLIENTETGSTIAKHNLKIIDTLFESSACLVGNTEAIRWPEKKDRIAYLLEIMKRGVEAGCVC
jgi:ATP phosphoribosyltransferase